RVVLRGGRHRPTRHGASHETTYPPDCTGARDGPARPRNRPALTGPGRLSFGATSGDRPRDPARAPWSAASRRHRERRLDHHLELRRTATPAASAWTDS